MKGKRIKAQDEETEAGKNEDVRALRIVGLNLET